MKRSLGSLAVPAPRVAAAAVAALAILLTASTAAAQAVVFTELEGFATKTGFRGVFTWKANTPVRATVHYGLSPDALTQSVTAVPSLPDVAGIAVASNLERGRTYYWQVSDAISGAKSPIRQFDATNAYTSWNGELYTINMLLQLDTDSLPPDIPHDLALQEIANGMNIFAERLYDALDGHARLGKVIVTDTNLDYAANQPFGDPEDGVACDGENATVADVIVQTTVPFDSHTWSGWSIDKPCIGFYVGRIGQLVVPWEDELHFGYVSTHELMHYAFNAPDLYDTASIVPVIPTVRTKDCRNSHWDGSVMHNTGGWIGRWDLTELDRNPTLTPCLMGNEPYTWDVLRQRYTNVPLAPNGPIADMFNYKAKGNPDGDGLEIWILDRQPATSTLTRYFPDDTVPACSQSSPAVVDKAGDGSTIHTADPGLVSDPNLDIVEGSIRWNAAGNRLDFTIRVTDLLPVFAGSLQQTYRWYFDYEGKRYLLRATRDVAGTQTRALLNDAGTVVIANGLPGSFDDANNRVTISLPADAIPGATPFSPGQRLDGFELYARRDFNTGTAAGGVSLITDTARGSCPYIVNQENFGPNRAPVAQNDSASTAEDVPVDINVLANDSDPDGDALRVHSVSASEGSASINSNGTVRFVPAVNQSGVQTFTYVARDAKGASSQASVTVTVTGIQDAPTAVADVVTASSGAAVTIPVLANDSDADGDPLTLASVSAPTFGRAEISGPNVIYTPGGGFATEDSFTYTISDGNGGIGRATVTVIRTCLGSWADDLEPEPNAGWSYDFQFSGIEGTGLNLTTWRHMRDPIASSPDHSFFTDGTDGSAVKDDKLVAPAVTFTSLSKLSFWHRYRTEVTFDGGLLEISTDGGTTWRDLIDAGGVFEKGAYPGPATAHGGRNAWHGASAAFPLMEEVVVNLGAFAGQTARIRWRFKTDANTGDLGWWIDDIRFRDIAVTDCGAASNRAPDAVDDAASASQTGATSIAVLANDSDPDGDPIFISSVTQPANGEAAITGSTVSYTPDAGFGGTDSFYYTISDGFGGSDLALVTVTVNAAPAAANDVASTMEDQATTIAVLANDSDPNGDTITITSVGAPSHGTATIVGDSIAYTPAANYNGADQFTYVVSDGRGGSATATVNVTVTAVNDAPVAQNDSATCQKNSTVAINARANDSDADGDTLSIVSLSRPANGSVSVSSDGTVRYRPKSGFTGSDSFTYTVSDGNGGTATATVSVTVLK